MKQRSKSRKKGHGSDKRVAKRTVQYFREKNKYSKYVVKEQVLVRFGKKEKKAPKRRYVLIGKL